MQAWLHRFILKVSLKCGIPGDLRFSPSLCNCKLLEAGDWVISFSWTWPPAGPTRRVSARGRHSAAELGNKRRPRHADHKPGRGVPLFPLPDTSSLSAARRADREKSPRQARPDRRGQKPAVALEASGLVLRSGFSALSSPEPRAHDTEWKDAGRRHVAVAAGSPSQGWDVPGKATRARSPAQRRRPGRSTRPLPCRVPRASTFESVFYTTRREKHHAARNQAIPLKS